MIGFVTQSEKKRQGFSRMNFFINSLRTLQKLHTVCPSDGFFRLCFTCGQVKRASGVAACRFTHYESAVQGGRNTQDGRKGGERMYTEYGYIRDGVEYATVDEAYDSE